MITARRFFLCVVLLYGNIVRPDIIFTDCIEIYRALRTFGLEFINDELNIMHRLASHTPKQVFVSCMVNHKILAWYKENRQEAWDQFLSQTEPTMLEFFRVLGFYPNELWYQHFNKRDPLRYYLNHTSNYRSDLSITLSEGRAPRTLEEAVRFFEVVIGYLWEQLRQEGDIKAFSVMVKTVQGKWSVCLKKKEQSWQDFILAGRSDECMCSPNTLWQD